MQFRLYDFNAGLQSTVMPYGMCMYKPSRCQEGPSLYFQRSASANRKHPTPLRGRVAKGGILDAPQDSQAGSFGSL